MTIKPFQPMLAYTIKDTSKLTYPLLASIKFDGMRVVVKGGETLTRSLKSVPNEYICKVLSDPIFDQLDGEIIVGPPNAEDVFLRTSSAVRSRKGEPDFRLYVFDTLPLYDGEPFTERYARLKVLCQDLPIVSIVDQVLIRDEEELLAYESQALEAGYEGLMGRTPYGSYRFGRASAKSAELGKLKRWLDSEARVTGFEPLYKNENEAIINELGRTERSSHKENKVAQDTLGVLIGVDVHTGAPVRAGSGFSAAQRKEIWDNKGKYMDKMFKYKHFPVGAKDTVRFPIFKSIDTEFIGIRDEFDMGGE